MDREGEKAAAFFEHEDALAGLEQVSPLADKLAIVHGALRQPYLFIGRVSVAAYDDLTGVVKTFADSNVGDRPLVRYEARLEDVPLLKRAVEMGRPRIINDMGLLGSSHAKHTRRIRESGFAASYAQPLTLNGVLWGFLFFDSTERNVLKPDVVADLDVFAHLIGALATHELSTLRILLGALKTAIIMVHECDPETGEHLQRMGRFARLIAQELAESGRYALDDEFIEHVFLFAPLHDVGKIGIPDAILLKRGRLSEPEFEVMKSHAERGRRIIDSIIRNFRLGEMPFVDVLRHIAEMHHEAMDDSGYPLHLRGEEIPIEARIAAVADIFDALTSHHSYKEPWTNDEAFVALRDLARSHVDHDCVEALARRRADVEAIQERFREKGSEDIQ